MHGRPRGLPNRDPRQRRRARQHRQAMMDTTAPACRAKKQNWYSYCSDYLVRKTRGARKAAATRRQGICRRCCNPRLPAPPVQDEWRGAASNSTPEGAPRPPWRTPNTALAQLSTPLRPHPFPPFSFEALAWGFHTDAAWICPRSGAMILSSRPYEPSSLPYPTTVNRTGRAPAAQVLT